MRKLALLFYFAAGAAFCQDAQPDRVTVRFSDPSRPKSLHASLINGGIIVKGYDGKDAIVERDAGRLGTAQSTPGTIGRYAPHRYRRLEWSSRNPIT